MSLASFDWNRTLRHTGCPTWEGRVLQVNSVSHRQKRRCQLIKTAPDDSSVTELPLNIDVLRRYSRQQRQEITSRLRKSARESSDQAFTRTARGMRTSIDDETALTWGQKSPPRKI